MPAIDNYTEAALRESGNSIENYQRSENNGVIIIKYDLLNRAEGAAIGAAAAAGVGWCGKLGLVVASAAVPIAFPVVAGILVTTTLGAPVAGAVAGAVIGRSHPQERYFRAASGELLSNRSRNEAAEKQNDKGDEHFRQGDYSRAEELYNSAYYNCSGGYSNEKTFQDNRGRARDEASAKSLNAEGDRLFEQGRFEEARAKYHEAYDKSRVAANYGQYKANRDRAQAVALLETLWTQAWSAEEDDRADEAGAILQRLLSECNDGLSRYPDNPRFRRYHTIVTLKIEGNQLFNQGVELHQEGLELLRGAEELRQRNQLQSADSKLTEARAKLCQALGKFTEGSRSDRRFLDCVEIVQAQIEEVTEASRLAGTALISSAWNFVFGSSRTSSNNQRASGARDHHQQI